MLPFFKHQLTSVNFFQKRERGFDASDAGSAKTRVQITVFSNRRARKSGCALIIAPKSLLRSAWEDDFKKFAPHLTISIAEADKRDAAFAAQADAYVINTDGVRWLAKQPKSFFDKFDTLIVDEVTAFKHRTSQRSKCLAAIKKYFKYRYIMTGTPNANTILDIWHPVSILDDGAALGRSFYHFRECVCSSKQIGPMPNMREWSDKPGAEDTVAALIRHMTIRHKLEECIDMPANTERTINYHLSNKQLLAYRKMEKDQIVELVRGTTIEKVSAINAAAVTTKLLQIASGAVYGEKGVSLIDTGRYELISDLIEERKHSVVFFNWAHQKDELIKEFVKREITYVVIDGTTSSNARHEAVDLFQKGFYRVLLAHPASAGHGLTLTRATTTIWASPTYNLEHFLQGNRRIYRAGQTQRTETIVVVAQGTIDEIVMEKIKVKDMRQASLLAVLKERN